MKRFLKFFCLLLLLCLLTRCIYAWLPKIPKSGIWRNDELNITIDMSNHKAHNTEVIKDGISISCFAGTIPNSAVLMISTEERIEGVCKLGETLYVFYGTILTSENKWILKDAGGIKYVFYRIYST